MPFAPPNEVSDSGLSISATARCTRTLVELTRAIWTPECTFATAIATICEAAAFALEVECVSIWHYDADTGLLHCLNTWDAQKREHSEGDDLDSLAIDAEAYMETLRDVRSLVGVRPGQNALREPQGAFPDYIRRHRLHAVLDAPACLGGELLGAICHESANSTRGWSDEEATFAASMGDYVAMAYEIDRRRRAEAEVEHLLLHDATTGLPNRHYMIELIRQRLSLTRHADLTVAVILVLIDSSTVSSSEHSPSAEDIMVRIALELRSLCEDEVELSRVHSNKLAFLLTRNAQTGNAIQLAERSIAQMRGLDWAHAESVPRISVGISFATAGKDENPTLLLARSEEAAQRAQDANNQGYEVFEPAHHELLVERLRMERVLRDAFVKREFEVHYQPEYDAVEKQWVAAEALLRWKRDGVVREAGDFIEVAESSGLMIPLGDWVLRQACDDAARWPVLPDGSLIALRVNVSAGQFAGGSLVGLVASSLRDSGLAPERLCLELTETTLMGNIDAALQTLIELRATGVQIAIDDFGTGFASLVYLKRFPVNTLKIDRSFVKELPENQVDMAIVSALVGLAGVLALDVIAEGVESIRQQDALAAIGVRRMQGWLYARAMPQTDLIAALQTSPSVAVAEPR